LSSWGFAARNLRRRRTRTILTVSGIVVGIATIVVLFSLAAGASTQTSGLLRNVLGAEITVTNSTVPTFPGGGTFTRTFGGGGGGFGGGFGGFFGSGGTLDESLVSNIDNITGVYAASPQLTSTAYVDGDTVFLYGIDPATYSSVTNGLTIVNGSGLSASGGNQILVSNSLASNLDIGVGSTVTVGPNSTGGSSYTVTGVFNPGTSFGPGARSVYVPLANAQTIAGKDGKVTEIYVKANTADDISTVAAAITSSISGVNAVTSSSLAATGSALSDTLTSFFTIIGLVALMAGAFGVVNTMMMSTSERTREIGTLKALGAQRGTILKTFLSEALLIGLIGGLAGITVGAAISFVLPSLTGSGAAGAVSSFGGPGGLLRGGLQTSITATNLLLGVTLGVIVGTLAGIYPAWRASKMDPVEALRHV